MVMDFSSTVDLITAIIPLIMMVWVLGWVFGAFDKAKP